MIALAKHVLVEYIVLLLRWMMTLLGMQLPILKNYEKLCDCEIVLGLSCMLLMLEAMKNLFKLAKGIYTLVCDLVTSIIICIIDLYAMYIDLEKRYDYPCF
jgi:hypothetical protein